MYSTIVSRLASEAKSAASKAQRGAVALDKINGTHATQLSSSFAHADSVLFRTYCELVDEYKHVVEILALYAPDAVNKEATRAEEVALGLESRSESQSFVHSYEILFLWTVHDILASSSEHGRQVAKSIAELPDALPKHVGGQQKATEPAIVVTTLPETAANGRKRKSGGQLPMDIGG